MDFPFQNNPENLGPSYNMDLDFSDYFGRQNLCLITKNRVSLDCIASDNSKINFLFFLYLSV